jgi:hypothetical protein
MTTLQGLVQHVETQPAVSFAEADAAISDTVVYVAQIAPFLTESGTCTVDIAGVEYTATPDTETDSLTLSPALSVAVTEGDLISLTPAAEIKWAFVVFDGDDSGDWMQCRVPHELVGYVKFEDGPRELDAREAVLVETEPEPRIVTMVNQPTSIDATTTPIIVSTELGESVRIDGDGITTYTDDPVPVWSFHAIGTDFEIADGFLYTNGAIGIHKWDLETGEEVTGGGFPIAGAFSLFIAADGTYVAGIDDVSDDVVVYDASDGSLVRTIAGSFIRPVGLYGGYVYAGDSSNDIRRWNIATGVEDTTNFPIVGTEFDFAIDDGYLYSAPPGAGGGNIRKFDATTGVEDTTNFPISGTFGSVAVSDGYVYATAALGGDVRKFDATTGVELTGQGFPIVGDYAANSAGSGVLAVTDLAGPFGDRTLRVFNIAAGYQSTRRDSSDGTDRAHALTVSDLTATGDVNLKTLSAPADLLAVTWTKARKTAAQSTGTGTAETVGQSGELYGAFDGSGTNGDTAFWTESNGVFTILEDGVYDLSCWVEWASNATGYRLIGIALNGSTTLVGDTRNAVTGQVTRQSISPAGGVALVAGNTVELLVLQTSGGNLNVNSGSWFTISRRGALAA